MKLNRAFLLAALTISPTTVFGVDENSVNSWVQTILKSTTITEAEQNLKNAKRWLDSSEEYKDQDKLKDKKTAADNKISEAITNIGKNIKDVNPKDTRFADQKAADLKDKQDAYDEAKANEQSLENRTLTAVTTAATGIGTMELLQGRAEQKADKEAEADMSAYISTFRCSYADGKSVKGGPEEIELPGANNPELMKLRNEYTTLAADLKIRKEALGMKPGIEAEEILDKASAGLYDDENVGKTGGKYASLYRAQALGSEQDQAKLNEDKEASKKRVVGGAVAAGVGTVVGVAGNLLINGELGEKIKEGIANKKIGEETQALLKKEAKALKDLQSCLKRGGADKTDELNFENFFPSVLTISSTEKCQPKSDISDKTAKNLFADDTDETKIYNTLAKSFETQTVNKMIGVKENADADTAKKHLKDKIADIQKKFKDAEEKDKAAAEKAGISIGKISSQGKGLSAVSSLFNGVGTSSDETSSAFNLLNY